MFHTDERDVPEQWRETMDALSLRPQMRSDVQRHAVLRRYGGLWLDADVRLIADPVEWTAAWDRYTAVLLRPPPAMIGTDLIYVPEGWVGWPLIEAEIDRVLAQTAETRRVGVLALAHRMIDNCRMRKQDAFQILEPGTLWPHDQAAFTTASLVARGFDPPADPPPEPQRPGLGDLIASGLASIGITKELAQAVASRVGIKDCGCHGRQAAANRLGTYLGLPPGSTAEG